MKNIPLILKEDEHIAYGWDGIPFIAKNESNKSKISIQYIVNHQDNNKDYDDIIYKIYCYMDDLMIEGKFNVVDDFIKEFCENDICFQYCLVLLTCANWAKDKINNYEIIKTKSIETGNKEIGKKRTKSCLTGLI